MTEALLEVKHLATEFITEQGVARALDDISFHINAGETLGIVGESGCGKSVTSLSIMRLLPRPAGSIVSGEVLLQGQDLTRLAPEEMHHIRGNRIAMIFQEPMTALNPVYRVERQLGETLVLHNPQMSKDEIRAASIRMLKRVGIPAPERRMQEYPHQLSGGMRQRVMIAIALLCEPEILIADEPTTALDVTIQAQILQLLKDLQQETGMAIIFITHDLGVIAEVCDRVLVMYSGRIIEQAEIHTLFDTPLHPYTRGLMNAIPRLDKPAKQVLSTIPGMVPSLFDTPPGCRFQNRCEYAQPQCRATTPPLEGDSDQHQVRCFRFRELMH
ncbi:MAG: ABC transporter ATP-binding protein [Gammaproteobacteria bacterium]|nr:ABC transporter ATP-binding protein [Gammaproteobacteria bacterium]MBL6999535.1 ABC transporter ATP-binding protein [Gammaproteobacteria bacterium]